jgi:hypothetical protein
VTANQADEKSQLCWICRKDPATTGEHKIKHSDLRGVFGRTVNQRKFFYHDLKKPNLPVQSFDAKSLKGPIKICAKCNNERTQSHDRAWERMSANLRGRTPFKIGSLIRRSHIFRYDTRRQMLNVHLFFLKLFGAMIIETKGKAPIDVTPFADAIMSERAHPEVYLQFGKGDGTVGRSNLECIKIETGHIMALWLYRIGPVTVNVMYAQDEGVWEGLSDTWHPKFPTKRIEIADFTGPKDKDDAGEAEPAAVDPQVATSQ